MTIDSIYDLFENIPVERMPDGAFAGGDLPPLAKSKEDGMTFTFMWTLDCAADAAYIDHEESTFQEQGNEIC